MAVGAAATSAKVRKAVMRGMVYGVAGTLIAYDKVTGLAAGAVRGARQGAAGSGAENQEEDAPAQAAAPAAAAEESRAAAARSS
jgi:hypothetical protein